MKKRLAVLFLALAMASTPGARADLCTLDVAPAATLLLPYFEVDLADPVGRTTLFSINNSVARPVLAHVVLWTDLAVPTLAFDVYLTGYDIETINLRDILLTGHLPHTADLARDPQDTQSPQGSFSQDGTFPGCEGLPPADLPASMTEYLRRAHTGQELPLLAGQCASLAHGDTGIARGYVTIDVATRCSSLRPNDPGYFGTGGVAGFDNVLWGDFFYVDPTGRFAEGDNLVRIEASPDLGTHLASPTFYDRYVNGTGTDGREPLATAWATRYLTGGVFSGGTDLVAWREVPWDGAPFPCSRPPTGFPLSQKSVIAFDEDEHPEDLSATFPGLPPGPPPNFFPAAATRVRAGTDLPLPFNFGWLLLDLAPGDGGAPDPYAQAWVGQVSTSQGRYSVGFQGTALNSLCAPSRCSSGAATGVQSLCVGATQPGQAAHFTVTPKGCFSTACNQLVHAGCAVQDSGPDLRLDSLICVDSEPRADPCISDCSGIGTAGCDSGPLAAGTYTAHLGLLELTFPVPTAGLCVSAP